MCDSNLLCWWIVQILGLTENLQLEVGHHSLVSRLGVLFPINTTKHIQYSSLSEVKRDLFALARIRYFKATLDLCAECFVETKYI